MHRPYSDHTPQIAIGNAEKEWRQMARLALVIREGKCPPTWAAEQEPKFIGIFKRLLEDPIDYVEQQANRNRTAH